MICPPVIVLLQTDGCDNMRHRELVPSLYLCMYYIDEFPGIRQYQIESMYGKMHVGHIVLILVGGTLGR